MLQQDLVQSSSKHHNRDLPSAQWRPMEPSTPLGAPRTTNMPHQTTWHGTPVPQTPLTSTNISPLRGSTLVSQTPLVLREPDTFSGHSSPDAWIFAMKTYLKAKRAPDDEITLAFVTSFLREDALLWWRRHCIEWPSNHPARIKDWSTFVQAIEANFRPVNQEARARDMLAELRQRGSARTYTREFRQLAMEIPSMPTHELQDKYIRGLKSQIKVEVEKSQALGLCQTLEEVITMAEKMDTIISQQPMEETSRPTLRSVGRRHPWGMGQPRVDAPLRPPHLQPTRILTDERTKAPGLSQEDREKLRKQNKCFYCKEIGHIAVHCPKKGRPKINQVQLGLCQNEERPDASVEQPDQQGNDSPQ